MIYLLKVSANSKRFGELIERDSFYSEVFSSLDKLSQFAETSLSIGTYGSFKLYVG